MYVIKTITQNTKNKNKFEESVGKVYTYIYVTGSAKTGLVG